MGMNGGSGEGVAGNPDVTRRSGQNATLNKGHSSVCTRPHVEPDATSTLARLGIGSRDEATCLGSSWALITWKI
jgi:hypothetical protein